MNDPCKGKKPGHKLPSGKICKGLLDTIEEKAKSRMARKFKNKNLQAVTWVKNVDLDDDNKENKPSKPKRQLPHNPNFGKARGLRGLFGMKPKKVEQEYQDMAARFTKSAGRRKRRTRRRKKRSKKKKRRRTKKKKKRRRGYF